MTFIGMETLFNIIWRVGHVNASGTQFYTQLTSANFTVQPPLTAGILASLLIS